MKPSLRLLQLAGLWTFASIPIVLANIELITLFSLYRYLWTSVGVLIPGLVLVDYVLYRNISVNAHHDIKNNFAIGSLQPVAIIIYNPCSYTLDLEVFDHYPQSFLTPQSMPLSVIVGPSKSVSVQYDVFPTKRGLMSFPEIEIRIKGKLGTLKIKKRIKSNTLVKVYPNFLNVTQLDGMNDQAQLIRLGLHQRQKLGEGTDFHQLRSFRSGDSLRQIDWKASSRYNKLISKEFQDERDQQIIFLLDCGRNMHTKVDDLSHLDHCMNAFLISAHVAVRHGDSVGAMSFAGEPRFINPMKGKFAIKALMSSLYDLQPSMQTPDYLSLANQLMSKHQKRSLIVLITNINPDDAEDLIKAISILNKKHLLLIASLHENSLDSHIQKPITTLEEGLFYSATMRFISDRHNLIHKIKRQGVVVIDSTPNNLHTGLINEYISMKRSNRL